MESSCETSQDLALDCLNKVLVSERHNFRSYLRNGAIPWLRGDFPGPSPSKSPFLRRCFVVPLLLAHPRRPLRLQSLEGEFSSSSTPTFFFLILSLSLSLFLSFSLSIFFIFLPFWNSSSVPLYCPRPMKHFPVWESFNHFFFCRPAFMFSVCCHLIYSYVKKNNVGLPIYDIHKAIRLNYTIWIESSICGKKNRHSFESNFGWFQYETDLPSRLCDLPS